MERLDRARVMAAGATLGAMIVTPFVPAGGTIRRLLTSATVAGLAVTTAGSTAARWGRTRTAGSLSAICTITHAVESFGVRTAVPFGRYAYRPALQPQIAGVPAAVPVAWFAMAIPAREVAHVALGGHSTPLRRVVVGAVALTAWDVFLDPQMTAEGYWNWSRGGRYRGIPATNFLGWMITGLAIMAILETLLPPGEPSPPLVVQYGAVGAMEAAAFATFFGDRTVAVAGSVAMLPLAAAALARLLCATHERGST